jgi:hypothetical protein
VQRGCHSQTKRCKSGSPGYFTASSGINPWLGFRQCWREVRDMRSEALSATKIKENYFRGFISLRIVRVWYHK